MVAPAVSVRAGVGGGAELRAGAGRLVLRAGAGGADEGAELRAGAGGVLVG